ncbi:MAG: NAD(P)H-hydrate dehydratase [Planctomycetota bacterium]
MTKRKIPKDLPRIPKRSRDAHKGDFGSLLIIGGSRGMSGAVILAARAAYRAGIGKATVAVPGAAWIPVASQLVEPMTVALDDRNHPGEFTVEMLDDLVSRSDFFDAVVLGCGLGRSSRTAALVNAFVPRCRKPLLLDADALTQFDPSMIDKRRTSVDRPLVLTPHPGEMAALCGEPIAAVQSNRESVAARFARTHACVLALKGNATVIAENDRIAVNPTGNPGMATGGSGDVLSGVIGALLASGMSGFDAARLGVYLHGRAGDIRAETIGETSLIASDIIDGLANAIQETEE